MTDCSMLSRKYERLFWLIVVVYCAVWFLLPCLFQHNLRPDSVEQFFVGKEWVLSSAKHPTLTAWILEIFFQLFHGWECTSYFVSQLAVLIVLWCVWKLAKEYLPLPLALLVVLMSMNYRYLNIGSTYFHHSVSILPFWALAVLWFYNALKKERPVYWFLAGVALGGGLLCKYPMGLLAITFFLYLCFFQEERRQFRKPGFYLMAGTAALIFLPHFLWLIQHHFSTLKYASYLAENKYGLWGHVINPTRFFLMQMGLMITVLIPLVPLWGGIPHWDRRHLKTDSFRNRFLVFIVLMPVLLQILVATYSGGRMRSGLGTHLWLFFPLWAVYSGKLLLEHKRLVKAFQLAVIIIVVTIGCFVGYHLIPDLIKKDIDRTDFPGDRLAKEVESVWHEYYDIPIPYVAGEWELGGNLAFYGKDRPSVHAFGRTDDFDSLCPITTWSTDADLDQHGAVVLWTIRNDRPLVPESLTKRFPQAIPLHRTLEIPYQVSKDPQPCLRVGVAVIPVPGQTSKKDLHIPEK